MSESTTFEFMKRIDIQLPVGSGVRNFDRKRRLHSSILAALDELAEKAPRGTSELGADVQILGYHADVTVRGTLP